MIRYLLVMTMIILTPPKGNGGMPLAPKPAVDGSGWVISFTLSFGLEGGTQIGFDKEDEYLSEIDRLNELFNVIL